MIKKQNTKVLALFVSSFILCIVLGYVFLEVVYIPFGFLFQTILYLFALSLVLLLTSIALICYCATQRWLTWLGIVPVLLAVSVIILTIIINTDYRILYFRSFSPNPTKAEWTEDLNFLADQMKAKHRDLFALVNKDNWESAVEVVRKRIPSLSSREIVMELFKLTALPNDNHSFPFIMLPGYDLHSFPFQVYGFPEGWFIVNAGRANKDLIGARIIKIGSKNIDDIYKKYPLLLAAENEYSYKERFTYMIMMSEWLAYHGIIDNIKQAEFTLENKNGEEVIISVDADEFYPHFLWSNIFAIDNDKPPVFTNPRKDFYWFEYIAEHKAIYIQFNQSVNQPGRETVDEFAHRLNNFASTHDVNRCLIDIRNNDGGDRVYDELIEVLRTNKKINQQDGLFILIGRRTFSAAVMFATQMQLQTKAILVGEPTGQGPIFFAGPTLVKLPNSYLEFAISTHLTISGLPFDNRRAIFPDIEINYSYKDFKNGHDPALDVALNYKSQQRTIISLPEHLVEKYTGRYLLNSTFVMDIKQDGNKLQAHLTDFNPINELNFYSELYATSEKEFSTDIKDVYIKVLENERNKTNTLVLDWMGNGKILYKASNEFISAFELFSLGKITRGCDVIHNNKKLYLTNYPDLENILNRFGYVHLRQDSVKAALKIFRLNVDLFPESFNVYDSFGEALMVDEQIDLAIQNYKTSLELNPENKNAERVIKTLINQ